MTAKEQALIEQAQDIVRAMDEELQTVMANNRDCDLRPLLGRVAVQHGRMRSLLIHAERDTPYPGRSYTGAAQSARPEKR